VRVTFTKMEAAIASKPIAAMTTTITNPCSAC